ncbi:MAG TPA: molybdopterin molybdotransferase MoeA [Candidatus Poseidoniales archaeon]|jgi:molybdopterin molybdotransferase|nr:MAG: hypothetical protein CXT67_04105 [Euryarchaeota archaeon]HIG03154.1 molybdopterin molybdotransferase MoeA [Candidatus Poseidoniales archaeon]HIK78039.1 molybdopterin molybdenumtransferase MoeA [Candidatus Poseidoniales archaeon]
MILLEVNMEGETPYFIPVEQAKEISQQITLHHQKEYVSLDGAHGRILFEDLSPLIDDPAFDNSSMDGWAVIHSDTLLSSNEKPVLLQISGVVQAGLSENELSVKSGNAIKIMTGAPIPKGADSIIQVECTKDNGDGTVSIFEPSKPHFIRHKAENLSIGKAALFAGNLLTPDRVGLCATMGHKEIPVVKKMKIAIISTGDELILPGNPIKFGQIYESNSFGIVGLIRWLGHDAIRFPSVADTLETLRAALNKAAKETDLILTTGGVSMGEFDLVRNIMENEGEIKFWRVKIRPGSPPIFGTWKGTPIWGLPGNPVSSHVVFRMLVAPWIRNSTGAEGPIEQPIRVLLKDRVKAMKDGLTLRRLVIENSDEGLIGRVKTHQGSGNLNSLAIADALTLLPPGSACNEGDWVDAILL